MHLTYLFDPLCGWCYGAAPALDHLAQKDGVTLDLAPTGLFAGKGARPFDRQFAAYAWQNDQRIARLTDQPFSEAYKDQVLGNANGRFDSAPATLAIVAVGLSAPQREREALRALQAARYVDGRDNADAGVVAEVLQANGFATPAERVRNPDEALLSAYHQRISQAREDMARFGASGVPTVIVGRGANRRLLPNGALFGRFDQLAAHLQTA